MKLARKSRRVLESASGISLAASKTQPRRTSGKRTTLATRKPPRLLPPKALVIRPTATTPASSSTLMPSAPRSRRAAKNRRWSSWRARCRNCASRLTGEKAGYGRRHTTDCATQRASTMERSIRLRRPRSSTTSSSTRAVDTDTSRLSWKNTTRRRVKARFG